MLGQDQLPVSLHDQQGILQSQQDVPGQIRVLARRLHVLDALELPDDVPFRLHDVPVGQGEFLVVGHAEG
jgi:hypothetical protein